MANKKSQRSLMDSVRKGKKLSRKDRLTALANLRKARRKR